MSTRIVDEVKAFVIPAKTSFDNHIFVVAERGGDNNCFDLTGARSSRWTIMAIGDKELCLEAACDRCGACVGGGMVLARHKRTKPEDYVRAWRKAIDAAKLVGPFSLVATDGNDLTNEAECQRWYDAYQSSSFRPWEVLRVRA
jgi:hypothetical protein